MPSTKYLTLIITSLCSATIGFSAYAEDTRLEKLKSKYNTAETTSSRDSQSIIHKIRDKNYTQSSGRNLESEIINKHYVNPQAPQALDLTKYTNEQDFDKSHKKSVYQAKQLSQGVSTPSFDGNALNASYNVNGNSKISRDENGRVIFTEKTDVEKGGISGEGMDVSEVIGSGINHNDNQVQNNSSGEYGLKESAGSDIKVRRSVSSSLNYLKSTPEGTGMMQVDAYKAVTKANEENRTVINQDDPLFNASYISVSQTESTAFNDCTDTVQVIDVSNNYPRMEKNDCAIIRSAGPSFCEVHREVVSYDNLSFFTASFEGLLSAKKMFTTGNEGLKGNKHSSTFHSGHWDVKEDVAMAAYEKGGAIVDVKAVNNAVLASYKQTIDLWLGIDKAGKKVSPLGNAYDNKFGTTFLLNPSLESVIHEVTITLGETGALSYPSYNLSDDAAEVYIFGKYRNVLHTANDLPELTDDRMGYTNQYIDNEDGTYLHRLLFAEVSGMGTCSYIYEPFLERNELYCPNGDDRVKAYTAIDERMYIPVALNNTSRDVVITEEFINLVLEGSRNSTIVVEVYANIVNDTFKFKHKKDSSPYVKQLGPYGLTRDRALGSSDVYTDFKPAVSIEIIQPAMIIETETAYYPEGCLELAQPPNNSCSFDGTWDPIEEGTRNYPEIVLAQLNALYPGDTGYKTWIASANNYKCDPFNGGTKIIDGVAWTWEEVVEASPSCDAFESDNACEITETSCDIFDDDGTTCLLEPRVYMCDRGPTIDKQITITSNTCNMELPCMGGDCDTQEREINQSFDKALVGMSIAAGIRDDRTCDNEADPDSCVIFPGDVRQCKYEKTFSLGNDCCVAPEGINAAEYVGATWEISKATGLNEYVYDAAGGAWDSAVTLLSGSASESASAGLSIASNSLSGVIEGVAGNAANGVATSAGTETLTEGVFAEMMEEVKAKTLKMVYESLPEDLANMVFDQGAAAGGDYALSAGMEGAATALGYLAAAYNYYMYFKLALNLLTQCDDGDDLATKDVDMGIAIGNRQCIFIGRESVNFIQSKQLHCCFNSPLARIIVEQAIPQLGYSDKEDYHSAGCPGLTPTQLGDLDWDQIDLSEWYGLMIEGGILPSSTDEEGLTGSGRILNQEERKTARERTEARFSGTALSERQQQVNEDLKPSNIDCSISPKPAVCDYTGGSQLGSGN